MSSRVGTGRWSEVTDEVQPFGMSFVDIVASALICVVALLILWLQFIDPLGYIPGHSSRAGTDTQTEAMPGKKSKPGYAMPPLLLSILAKWPSNASATINVRVACDGGRVVQMRPNADHYAAATVRVASMSGTGCLIAAVPVGAAESGIRIFIRAITDGKQLFDASLIADDTPKDVLADRRSAELKKALGESSGPWAYDWSPVLP
ncbi:hypothetical protein ACC689_29065 [Rhizobium ruizarguesonis]